MDFFSASAYLFDIDGTLVNTRGAVHYFAFRNALKAVFGIEATIDGVPVHGNTDIGILRAVCRLQNIPDAEFEERLPEIVKMMSDDVTARKDEIIPDICPSIPELLAELKRRGKLIGVVTGNFVAIGWAKLEASGLREYFDFGCFSDHAELRSEIFRNGLNEVARRLGPNATTFILGDTPSDIQAAKAVGAPIISVATGIYPQSELQALGPDLSVGCCDELFSSTTRGR
jgi:phosphoglycolate phosphatase-like HAD superfamily hydrolase